MDKHTPVKTSQKLPLSSKISIRIVLIALAVLIIATVIQASINIGQETAKINTSIEMLTQYNDSVVKHAVEKNIVVLNTTEYKFSEIEKLNSGNLVGEFADAANSAVGKHGIFGMYLALEPNIVEDTPNGLSLYFYLDENGNIARTILNDYYDYSNADYYLPVKQKNIIHITDPYEWRLEDGKLVDLVTVAKPIYNSNNEFLGVLNCDFELDSLSELNYENSAFNSLNTIVLTKTGYFIEDSKTPDNQGQSLTSENGGNSYLRTLFFDEPAFYNTLNVSDDDSNAICYAVPITLEGTDLNWIMLSVLSRSEITSNVVDNTTINASIYLFCIITLSTFIILYISREIKVQKEKSIVLENALMKAEKFQKDREDFFARMSHDMRTPLNVILGLSGFGKKEDDTTIMRKEFEDIEISGKYLLGLINDILEIQRFKSSDIRLDPSPSDIREFIKTVLNIEKKHANQKGVEFITEFNDNMPQFHIIDEQRLLQIHINVISNAIKYTPEGGKVNWKMQCLCDTNGYSYFRTEVIDTGIGMSEEFICQVFEPYSRENTLLTEKEEGAGLGLAITNNLVKIMGGTISCSSTKGKGSTFIIEIPTSECSEEVFLNSRKKIQQTNTDFSGKHILLCEDNAINARIATRLLESKGMIVDHAENGEVGIQKAKGKNFDAIVMDIRMPIMDGLTATIEIRKFDRETPIVALSANAYSEDIQKSIDVGMNAHLAKPIEADKLFSVLGMLI